MASGDSRDRPFSHYRWGRRGELIERTLRELDVAVPGRVRVVGVDGLEIGALVTPELTTLAIDIEAVARETVELVAGMLEGTTPLRGEGAHRLVPYRLEVRASA